MKYFHASVLLLGSSHALQVNTELSTERHQSVDKLEQKLSQSIASAFQMEPPRLMNATLPAGKESCPSPGMYLKHNKTGGAFLDGCYMNTTRKQARNEMTG